MPADAQSNAEVPVHYILDILGNVLFVQILRGVIIGLPVYVADIPEVNLQRVIAFFQQASPNSLPQIQLVANASKPGPGGVWEIRINYKTKTLAGTPFPGDLLPEEDTLIQRLRETTSREFELLQLQNFFAKITKIREIYAQAPPGVRQDAKKLHGLVQQAFRKTPISREFVQFIAENQTLGKR